MPETEGIESKAKSISEIVQKRNQWLEDFKNGALGNQEAYARARDNRPLFEFHSKWVPLEEVQKLDANYKIMYTEILKQLKIRCDKLDKVNEILTTLQPIPENKNQEKDLENFVDRLHEALK